MQKKNIKRKLNFAYQGGEVDGKTITAPKVQGIPKGPGFTTNVTQEEEEEEDKLDF